MIESVPTPQTQPEPSPGPPPPPPPPRKKLDLSQVSPPRQLDAVRIEELTIDGICGVY